MNKTLLLLCLVLTLTFPASAWGEAGHILVARIALAQMSDHGRQSIQDLLSSHPDPQVRNLETASVWPDLVRDEYHLFHHHHHMFWHFQNRPIPKDHQDFVDRGQLLEQLEKQTQRLRDTSLPKSERAIALCWVAHLVGDLHQPLHNSNFYSEAFPYGDQGGNLFQVRLGQKELSLHKLWDKVGGRFIEPASDSRLEAYAQWFQLQHPKKNLADQLKTESFQAWSDEGYTLAQGIYERAKPGEPLSNKTLQETLDITRQRVVLAGYRLGQLLDE